MDLYQSIDGLMNWYGCATDESDGSVAGDVDSSTKKTYGESHTIIKMQSCEQLLSFALFGLGAWRGGCLAALLDRLPGGFLWRLI